MEEDEIQAQACKFPRVRNGRNESNKIGSSRGSEQYQDEEEDVELRRRGGGGGGGGSDGSTNHFQSNWHHSSRIIRVSRASGGKDRHSKVMTSKGLRDRRVRLSVTTAIQFYDLQDRLGYDQPSKAVEWLIKAASDAISELPSLNNPFPETPKQPSDEKRASDQQGFDDGDGDNSNYQQNQSQNLSLSKSACSSTSETSKGSGLSLSRSEIRVNREKARERARERAAKEKEKERDKEKESNNDQSSIAHHHHDVNVNVNHPMSHTASFTELLTGGIGSTVTVPTTRSPNGSVHQIHGGNDEANAFNKGRQQHWSSAATPMEYFSSGLLVGGSSSSRAQHSSGFPGHIQLGHPLPVSPFSGENHSDHQLQQHFSFMPEHLMVTSSASASAASSHPSGNDYNLNFTISSGLAGYNRGTLQSNSPSLLPHLQRFQPIDGSSNLPFLMGPAPGAPTIDNNNHNNNHHHLQFSPVFDGRLQLYYGDGTRHSEHKGKPKH